MVDFHTHILPGIDDGSIDADMSVQMLQEELDNDVSSIVFTPHFYADRDSIDHFIKRRLRSREKLEDAMQGDAHFCEIAYYYGAEVYYFGGMGVASDIRKLCIEGTNVLLLEMPFCQWKQAMYEDIRRLIRHQGLQIVLAHVERYIDFQKDREIWERILELPLHVQLNAGPFSDWKRRRKVLKLAAEQETFLLGSDAHNMQTRKPNLASAQTIIRRKLGDEYLKRQEQLEHQLLGV
ncbi:MAG: hypothetical protein MRZ65_00845 [Lachnospiraceae bacterium]|nr:hypothetical protein [Lachnospiraceae bacterium]